MKLTVSSQVPSKGTCYNSTINNHQTTEGQVREDDQEMVSPKDQ